MFSLGRKYNINGRFLYRRIFRVDELGQTFVVYLVILCVFSTKTGTRRRIMRPDELYLSYQTNYK